MQYRSPERYRWSGYAFPGGHIEKGESLHDAVVREILEETGLTITHPKLVGVKNWHTDEGVRYIVFCYKATEFSGQIHSTEEGEISWVDKETLPQLDLAYDMLELLRMMEDEELSSKVVGARVCIKKCFLLCLKCKDRKVDDCHDFIMDCYCCIFSFGLKPFFSF